MDAAVVLVPEMWAASPGAREDGGTGLGLRAGAAGGCGGGSGVFISISTTADSSLPKPFSTSNWVTQWAGKNPLIMMHCTP